MQLDILLSKIEYTVLKGDVHTSVTDLRYDSRKVSSNSVFVCISGAISDGHDYIDEVISKGASAIIVDRDVEVKDNIIVVKVKNTRNALAYMSAEYFDNPAKKLITIGITGTKGKTTTAYIIREALEKSGNKTGLIGTIETIIDNVATPAINTTPESYVIQEYFHKMVENGCKYVIMEVSSQGLKYNRVDGIIFDYGIFTNLSPDHIGEHEHSDFNDYLTSKNKLFRQCRTGIINIDDEKVDDIIKGHTCKLMTYGFSDEADFKASNIELINEDGKLGISYNLSGLLDLEVEIDIPGRFSIYNSLAAIGLLYNLKIKEKDINEILKEIKVKGRVELVNVSDKYILLIDYAHNAMSLESLLTTLREYNPKRLICMFGCGGNRAKDRRYEMGEVSSRLADLSVITSDNPRYEMPEDIINDIVVGIKRASGDYITIIDRKAAIKYCIDNAKEGDVIVLAGKGHEDYQEIKGKKYPMDERVIIKEIMEEDG